MSRLSRMARASIGRKLLMALTGLVLVIFLVGHLVGNLKVMQGPEALNAYAAWLQGHPLLWVMRGGMVSILLGHVALAVHLRRKNTAARPTRYVRYAPRTGFPERHLLLSGLFVLLFLVFHLLHLTVGAVDPAAVHGSLDSAGRPDVYARVVIGLRNPWIAGAYMAGLLILALHLQHALRSLFHTLGFSHESYQTVIEVTAAVVPGIIFLGFASIPALALTGALPVHGGGP